MDTTNFNKATAYFRMMEMIHPHDKSWGQFADAMDEVISTCVPVVRCKDCKHSGIDSTSSPKFWCPAHAEYHDADWFCADGERKG